MEVSAQLGEVFDVALILRSLLNVIGGVEGQSFVVVAGVAGVGDVGLVEGEVVGVALWPCASIGRPLALRALAEATIEAAQPLLHLVGLLVRDDRYVIPEEDVVDEFGASRRLEALRDDLLSVCPTTSREDDDFEVVFHLLQEFLEARAAVGDHIFFTKQLQLVVIPPIRHTVY